MKMQIPTIHCVHLICGSRRKCHAPTTTINCSLRLKRRTGGETTCEATVYWEKVRLVVQRVSCLGGPWCEVHPDRASHSYNTQHKAFFKPIIILHHIPHTHCYFPRLPLLSAFGVGFYLENLPAPVAVIARNGPSSSPPTAHHQQARKQAPLITSR
jgi:hypothetical protein